MSTNPRVAGRFVTAMALVLLGCSAKEPNPPASGAALPALPLRTESRWIVDANGERFKLAGVNWYGGESATLVPDGLAMSHRHALAKAIRSMGFNSVRLPWCNELVARNPIVDAARVAKNPDLVGKPVLEVLDAVIESLAAEGLVIILDNHRSRGDWCCDVQHGDGLWYTEQYPEADFIAHWKLMAERYTSQPAVVGMDLRNELRNQLAIGSPASCGGNCTSPTADMPEPMCPCEEAHWGDSTGHNRDWTVVAERVGDALLDINPNLLVIVEGTHWASWIGANYRPLRLAVEHRLVYSTHNYKMSQTFSDCPTLKIDLERRFGFVVEPSRSFTAPLWIGEFGIEHDGTDNPWWQCFTEYLKEKDLDWAYWALNGTQGPGYSRTDGAGEGYGVLNATWDAPANADHLAQLRALAAPTTAP